MMCVNSKLLQLSYDVVNSFYSKSMRDYFSEHPREFSIGQLASLATQHMDLEKVPQLLKALSEVSVIPEEKAYLKSAAEEWADENWSKTYELFEKYQKAVGDNSGRAIFCEKCHLPVFAKRGDPVIFKCGNKLLYGVVFHAPDYKKHEGFDLTDECYGIYSLEDKSPGLVYPWQIYDYLPVLLPNVEVVSEHALPEKKKELLNGFVRDMALLYLLTNQDWWNLYEEYEKNGHKQISLKKLVEKRMHDKMTEKEEILMGENNVQVSDKELEEVAEHGDKIMESLVNKQIINTKQGKIEIIKPNKNGDIILPKDWYDEEDEIYDTLSDKELEKVAVSILTEYKEAFEELAK